MGNAVWDDYDSDWEEEEEMHEMDLLFERAKLRMKCVILERVMEAKIGVECEPWDLSTEAGREGAMLDNFLLQDLLGSDGVLVEQSKTKFR